MRLAWTILAAAVPALGAQTPEPKAPAAYRAMESLSDGAYGLLRGALFTNVLPGRLTRSMAKAPENGSYGDFRRRLAGLPAASASGADERTTRDQRLALVRDAFVDTLVDRYRLEAFGLASGAYALDRRNWEPGFLMSATVLGSAYLWAAGVKADLDAGPVELELGLAPGWRWRGAAQGGSSRRLAHAELGARGTALRLRAEWGAAGTAAERIGLAWSRRF